MNKKRLLSMTLAMALTASLFTACGAKEGTKQEGGSDTANSDTIKIGALAPLTGGVAVYGVTASNGLKLAVEEVNANGGVLGKQIELLLEDEEGDPTKALNAYNKLMGQNVVAFWGDVPSKPTISVAQKAAKDNMPMITPTATVPQITEYGNNIFRACFLDPYQGEAMAQYTKDRLNAKTVAVLFDNSDDYSIGVAETFKEKAESLGIKVSAYESFNAGETDFKAQLSTIKSSKPDVLFIPSYYNTIALITIQAKELGVNTQLVGADGWDGVLGALDAGNVDALEGAIFPNHYFKGDEDKVVSTFVNSYREKFGEEPTAFAALGYDAAHILFEAIQAAGTTDAQAVIDALAKTEYTGVTGAIHYEGNGDPVKSITMLTIKDGEYQLLEKYSMN